MMFDLSLLHQNRVSSLPIQGEYTLPSAYYENSDTDVVELGVITVDGEITRKENEDFELQDYITCQIEGVMILLDSISLERVEYPYSIFYDDFLEGFLKKDENTLDIFAFLWQNIVLEVPLQFTKVRDLSKFHGDGWKVVSEEEVEKNNPFSDLLKDFEKE